MGDKTGIAGTTSWSKSVTLSSGSNTIFARATDTSGNSNEASVIVSSQTAGNISISSSPSGASIYLDSSYQGETPKTIANVSAGSHYIELMLDGYHNWSDSVDVPAGVTSYVSAPLSMSTTTLTPAKTYQPQTPTPTKTPLPPPTLTAPIKPETNWEMIAGVGALFLLVIAISKLKPKPKEEKIEKTILPEKIPPSPTTPSTFPAELQASYTSVEFIGEGGFAKVFKASRKKDNKTVAVKIPRLDEKTGRAFLNEITAWHNLNHENIVKLFDANVHPVPYLEMEYLDGIEISGGRIRDLEHYPKPLKEEKAVEIIKGIATGLGYAHTKGVVHRDLKPLNILITSRLTPKITDFGLAKLSAESKLSTLKGYSPLYAAPEQLDSATYGKPDERTDIYQVGVIFYELLTGKLPYEGYTQSEVSTKIITPAILPTRPSAHNPALEKYDDIVMKCIAKKKEERFRDVHEFLGQLETAAKKESLVEQLKQTLYEQKETLKKSRSSEEILKSRRMVVEILGKLAVIHAYSENKVELLNALEDLKFYTVKNLEELSKAIEQLEFLIKNESGVSGQFIGGIKSLVHKIRREYEI